MRDPLLRDQLPQLRHGHRVQLAPLVTEEIWRGLTGGRSVHLTDWPVFGEALADPKLVAITPAAGTVGPMGSIVIGLSAGVICFFCATSLKRKLGYDDSLDAFGVHGIGGIVGALLTGVFAAPALGGFGTVTDIAAQVWIQFKGVAFTVVYTAIVTFIILKVLDAVMGLRVAEEEEAVGLDLAQHNERGYNL